MSKVLSTAAAIIMLGVAAMGTAQARGNFDRDSHPFPDVDTQDTHPGYAGPDWPEPDAHFASGRGIVDEDCDMPDSTCSNSYRIHD
jgi:hypothetical protein